MGTGNLVCYALVNFLDSNPTILFGILVSGRKKIPMKQADGGIRALMVRESGILLVISSWLP